MSDLLRVVLLQSRRGSESAAKVWRIVMDYVTFVDVDYVCLSMRHTNRIQTEKMRERCANGSSKGSCVVLLAMSPAQVWVIWCLLRVSPVGLFRIISAKAT